MISKDAFDDVITRLKWMRRQIEEVYEARDTYPHYVEMDEAMSALWDAIRKIETARGVVQHVIRVDSEMRQP